MSFQQKDRARAVLSDFLQLHKYMFINVTQLLNEYFFLLSSYNKAS